MDFDFSADEKEFLKEIRSFIKREATPELLREAHENERIYGGPESRKFIKKFASNGWLTPDWPKEYGGLGTSEMLTYLIRDEMIYQGLPSFFVAAHMAGPTILREGSRELKERFLLPIAKGEIEFALGYTEPQAGSDLLALRMRAEDMGDYFLVNGQKIFNTHAHVADYHWLAARTDPTAQKHKGLSLFIVDLKSPGITIRPLITMTESRTNEVYYDDVKVPKENLVGQLNKGYVYLMAALDFERMFPFGHYRRLFENVLDYVKTSRVDGRPLGQDPLIRQKIADMAIDLEVCKLLYYQLPQFLDRGKIPTYQTSMEKIFMTERVAQRLTGKAMEILGNYGQLEIGSRAAPSAGTVSHFYRWSRVETIVGGSSEIQRTIIALRGLDLPRG